MRRLWLVLVLPVLLVTMAGPASAQVTAVDAAARALRSDPVYVDPASERAHDVSADRLRDRIRKGGTPMFLAVLPASAGDAGSVLPALQQGVGLAGTYAVVVGDSFRASSNVVPGAAAIASSTFQQKKDAGTQAVLETFVERVNDAADRGGSGTGSGAGGLLLLLALGGGGLYLWSRSRRRRERRQDQREFEGDRQMLQAELSVLGSDVLELEPHVTMHPDARPDYDAGVTRYKSAEAALEYADDQVDLVRVGRVIEEGRYAMARARARIDGREPPPPPEALTRPGRHDEPALDLDDRGQPVYVGYGGMPWFGGGWFGGGGGGLLTGLMLGEMLGGGGWGWGGGWGGYDGGDAGDGGVWDGGGDIGGGDWGGGDLGGGDFGGGDVGGGDW